MRSRYADLGLVATAVIGTVIDFTGNGSWSTVDWLLAALLLAATVNVYMKIQFARAISNHLGTRVGWLELPLMRMSSFDEWLDSVKSRARGRRT